jgi:hypothetical protein
MTSKLCELHVYHDGSTNIWWCDEIREIACFGTAAQEILIFNDSFINQCPTSSELSCFKFSLSATSTPSSMPDSAMITTFDDVQYLNFLQIRIWNRRPGGYGCCGIVAEALKFYESHGKLNFYIISVAIRCQAEGQIPFSMWILQLLCYWKFILLQKKSMDTGIPAWVCIMVASPSWEVVTAARTRHV